MATAADVAVAVAASPPLLAMLPATLSALRDCVNFCFSCVCRCTCFSCKEDCFCCRCKALPKDAPPDAGDSGAHRHSLPDITREPTPVVVPH